MSGQSDTWRFIGKYRGIVLDNADPQQLGRIRASVPAVAADGLGWALPCLPYAGPGVGFFAIPPIGASVWVEFEAGDPALPIWTGCFWADPAHVPAAAKETPGMPTMKGFITEFGKSTIDDRAGLAGLKMATRSGRDETVPD